MKVLSVITVTIIPLHCAPVIYIIMHYQLLLHGDQELLIIIDDMVATRYISLGHDSSDSCMQNL
jgi:predicted metal-dependent phosphotriesterase family hydrolase